MRTRALVGPAVIFGTLVVVACVGEEPSTGSPGSSGGPQGDGAPPDTAPGPTSPSCGQPNAACCAASTCNGGAQCNGTICVCPAGTTACGDTCVDTRSDAKHCGRCDHDCLGGACAAPGKCAAYIVTPSQSGTERFLFDGDRLYWTRRRTSSAGGFFSAKLDGTDLVAVFDAAGGCTGLTTGKGKALFTCQAQIGSTREIRECTLPCSAGSSTQVIAGIALGGELAADPGSGKVFYTVATPYGQSANGGIFDLDGNRVGAANQANPVDVLVANGSVFWLNGGTYSNDVPQKNGGVKRTSLSALAAESVVITAGNLYYDNTRLAVDANDVYYSGRDVAENDTDIVSGNASATNAAPTVFADAVGPNVVSDGTNVFFDDRPTSSVRYCSRAGGCASGKALLSEHEVDVSAIAVDATSVVWATASGEIRRIAKP